MCGNTQSLDHQTATEWRIKHALYIEQMRKRLKHILSTHDKLCVGPLLEQCTRRVNWILDVKQSVEDQP